MTRKKFLFFIFTHFNAAVYCLNNPYQKLVCKPTWNITQVITSDQGTKYCITRNLFNTRRLWELEKLPLLQETIKNNIFFNQSNTFRMYSWQIIFPHNRMEATVAKQFMDIVNNIPVLNNNLTSQFSATVFEHPNNDTRYRKFTWLTAAICLLNKDIPSLEKVIKWLKVNQFNVNFKIPGEYSPIKYSILCNIQNKRDILGLLNKELCIEITTKMLNLPVYWMNKETRNTLQELAPQLKNNNP